MCPLSIFERKTGDIYNIWIEKWQLYSKFFPVQLPLNIDCAAEHRLRSRTSIAQGRQDLTLQCRVRAAISRDVLCHTIDVLTPRSSLMRIIQHRQHKKFVHRLAVGVALRNVVEILFFFDIFHYFSKNRFSKRQLRSNSACIFLVQPTKTR